MDATVLGIVGMCLIAVIVGAARITAWCLDRRDHAAVQRANEAAFVAQARSELDATGWTEDDEAAYQRDPSAYDRELPGMWEASDFMGGRDYEQDPVTRDEVNRGR